MRIIIFCLYAFVSQIFPLQAEAIATFDENPLDGKTTKFVEFSKKMADFYFNGVNNLDTARLVSDLKSKCSIEVNESFHLVIGNPGLKFLLGFCLRTQFNFHGEVSAVQQNAPSIPLFSVNRDYNQITFYANAFNSTLTANLLSISEQLTQETPVLIPGANKELNIEYTNTLILQLAVEFFSRQNYLDVIKGQFGIALTAPATDSKLQKESLDFTKLELQAIFKHLLTLGPLFNNKSRVSYIVKMAPNTIDTEGAIGRAYCLRKKRLIQISSKAYSKEDIQGEGTFIHELMHCIHHSQSDFETDYIPISWSKNSLNQWEIKPHNTEFIKTYSTTNPKEDFAEHGTSYVVRPATLWNTSQNKYGYFYNRVFDWTTYRFEANKQFRFTMNSDAKKDLTPPYIKGVLLDNLTVKLSSSKPREVTGSIQLNNVFDDHSNSVHVRAFFIKKTDFDKPTNNMFSLTLDRTGENEYLWNGSRIIYDNISRGSYCLKNLALEDSTGKTTIINTIATEAYCFILDSQLLPRERLKERIPPPLSRRFANVFMSTENSYLQYSELTKISESIDQGQLHEVFLPISEDRELNSLTFTFVGQELKNTYVLEFYVNCKALNCLQYDSQGGGYKGQGIIPYDLPIDRYSLKSISFYYSPSKIYKNSYYLGFDTPNALNFSLLNSTYKPIFQGHSFSGDFEFLFLQNDRATYEAIVQLNNQRKSELYSSFKDRYLNYPEEYFEMKFQLSLGRRAPHGAGIVYLYEEIDMKPPNSYLNFDDKLMSLQKQKVLWKELPLKDQDQLKNLFTIYLQGDFDKLLLAIKAFDAEKIRHSVASKTYSVSNVLKRNLNILSPSSTTSILSTLNSHAIQRKQKVHSDVVQVIKVKTNKEAYEASKEDRYYYEASAAFEDASGTAVNKDLTYSQILYDSELDEYYVLFIANEDLDQAIVNGDIHFKGISIDVIIKNNSHYSQISGSLERAFLETGSRIIRKKLKIDLSPENPEG